MGPASLDGSFGWGTVFAVNTDGTAFTNLYNFTVISGSFPSTNSDGARPFAGLILSGNTLYGTARYGGGSGNGTVFKVNPDGTGFTNLYSFTAYSGPLATNSDGAGPYAGLILAGNILYGTAAYGGSSGNGTVFAVNSDGTGFTNLHSFTALGHLTNSDGATPYAGLVLSGNTLYGTASGGGSSGKGTVFAVNTNGTGFTNLHSFKSSSDGSEPWAGLILSGNTLYGTTRSANGTVFSLSFRPQLTIIRSGANFILTWPTNAAGFTLQASTNLGLSAIWTTNLPGPFVVNGQNAVTNPVSGTKQFYRLSQ